MWKARNAFRGLLPARYSAGLLVALALWLGMGWLDPASARVPYDDDKTAEGWAWSQIKRGNRPDFNEHCGTPRLDPRNENDARWQKDCRKLSARFLQDLLTRAPWREATPFAGVQMEGARIVGDVDLEGARLVRAIIIEDSRIEGEINLWRARTDSLISFHGTLITGDFDANDLHSESDLALHGGAVFRNGISLNSAKIDGDLDMTGANFEGELNAELLQIGGSLHMKSDEQNKAKYKNVDLISAKVTGHMDLTGASLDGDLNAGLLQVGGNLVTGSSPENKTSFKNIIFVGGKITGQVLMVGTSFDGTLNADALQVGGNLFIGSDTENKASFKDVNLRIAKIAGNVMLTNANFERANLSSSKIDGHVGIVGARFDGGVDMGALQVGGSLLMNSSFKSVNLLGAKIVGQVNMAGSSFDGTLNADALEVGGLLLMRGEGQKKTTFKEVILRGAKIDADAEFTGASFEGALDARSLQVAGSLFMGSNAQNKASFKAVNLYGANIRGQFNMTGASFDGALDASVLRTGGIVLMTDAHYANKVTMLFAHIGTNLDLRGATMADVDLSGASVTGDLRLGGAYKSAVWKRKNGEPGTLNLRNVRIGNLMDATDAWPTHGQLRLDGFTFDHLGGFSGESGMQMRARGMNWWDDWARRDPNYSPSPYAQLANVFTNIGDRDAANEIRYLGREREHETKSGWTYLGSWLLKWVAGFGIGAYTFRVLYWVLGFSLAGALLLWWTAPAARRYGPIWCFGASLARLLPAIEINKEFTDFFNDPKRERLTGWQTFIFSAMGVVGWVLGGVLVVAVSGLTHSP